MRQSTLYPYGSGLETALMISRAALHLTSKRQFELTDGYECPERCGSEESRLGQPTTIQRAPGLSSVRQAFGASTAFLRSRSRSKRPQHVSFGHEIATCHGILRNEITTTPRDILPNVFYASQCSTSSRFSRFRLASGLNIPTL